MTERTIPRLFEDCVARYPNNVMMLEKKEDAYVPSTYREIQALVHGCGAGFMSLGVRKGDRVALIAEGRNDWVIAELGILYAGAINVPLSVKIEELSELKFRLAHSGCRMVVVSGSQAPKIDKIKADLPDLERLVLLDEREPAGEDELQFAGLLAKGREYLTSHRAEFDAAWQSLRENDPANICYTSGTTADPKGIILSHRNYTANVEQAVDHLYLPEDGVQLIILPWDHSFGHTAGIYSMVKSGACIASVQVGKSPMETLRNIPTNIKETKPTLIMSVPALAKSFRKNIEKGIREKGPKVEKLFQKALQVAIDYNGDGWDRGRGMRKLKKPLYFLYDKLIFSKIRESFGGRLQYFIGGGALLDMELQRFFYAIGIPMYQGYGLTEAAPIISANVPKAHKLGSSGKLLPRLEVKICDDEGKALPVGRQGEIVVKGENVMLGYWKNEKATAETIRDGWLHTGDLGYMDEDGFLYVLGREKSLLIGHDGEKFSPEGIEEAVVGHSAYIDQIMLHNNQSPYTVALVVPNSEAVLGWLRDNGHSCRTEEGQDAALKMLEAEVNHYRGNGKHAGLFPERWLPAALAVLGEGFTEQNRMLNSTLKMVRGKITEFYRNRIDFMFTPEGKNVCNHQNRMIIKRLEEKT